MSLAVGDWVALIVIVSLPILTTVWMIGWLRRHHWRLPVNPDRRELFRGHVLITAWLLSLMLLAGEIYYRFVYDATESYSACRTTQAWFARHYHLNESGFRDSVPEYLPRKAAGQRRLLILGDSFTAGHGVKHVEDRFANRLRKLLPDWEICVFAVCGYDTSQEVMLFEHLIERRCEADAILLAYCLNDIGELLQDNPVFQAIDHHKDHLSFVFRHSFFLNTIYGRLQTRWNPELNNYYGFLREAYAGTTWNHHCQLLGRMQQLATRHYPRFLVVTFPFLHNLGANYPFLAAHEALRVHWESQMVPHLDLLSVYQGQLMDDLIVSSRDAHPNERAHQLAAEALAPFIRQWAVMSPPDEPAR